MTGISHNIRFGQVNQGTSPPSTSESLTRPNYQTNNPLDQTNSSPQTVSLRGLRRHDQHSRVKPAAPSQPYGVISIVIVFNTERRIHGLGSTATRILATQPQTLQTLSNTPQSRKRHETAFGSPSYTRNTTDPTRVPATACPSATGHRWTADGGPSLLHCT